MDGQRYLTTLERALLAVDRIKRQRDYGTLVWGGSRLFRMQGLRNLCIEMLRQMRCSNRTWARVSKKKKKEIINSLYAAWSSSIFVNYMQVKYDNFNAMGSSEIAVIGHGVSCQPAETKYGRLEVLVPTHVIICPIFLYTYTNLLSTWYIHISS